MCEAGCTTEILKCNNDRILMCINNMNKQRDELNRVIRKQEEEKERLELELQRITFKLNVLVKSLAQRMITRDRYNESIYEAEDYYNKLVESSQALLQAVESDFTELDETMDKKCGTENKFANSSKDKETAKKIN